ncbi:MAG: phosphate transport system regulatory protein PhoU [Methyloligella sp.]|jgi:phosphate transport system protein|nr:MAG: phosphate transport system regulatory protein PhoU [Methyloligella sp.]
MTTEHIVTSYEDELASLDSKIAQMGGLTETLVAQAFDALCKGDVASANNVILDDAKIDEYELEIEEQAVTMIARRQPMALDLRQIMVAIKITSDLERIGDLGKNIAKRVLSIHSEIQPIQLMHGMKSMQDLALSQLKDVLDAYAERNTEKALAVWRGDEEIDAIYNSLFRELLTYMMEDPRNIGLCTHLLFCAKNLERIGDHTTNIAENVHYLVLGTNISEARPKGDNTSRMLINQDD